MDSGLPLTTEPNVLQELIKPPSTLSNLIQSVTGNSKNRYRLCVVRGRIVFSKQGDSPQLGPARWASLKCSVAEGWR